MKRLFIIITAILSAVSCANLDDVWEELREHEERIEKLETECRRLSSNIDAVQTVLEALQKNDYATAVTKIVEDGVEVGYSISFAQSGTIEVYNSNDKYKSPEFRVTDGIWFVSFDGGNTWMEFEGFTEEEEVEQYFNGVTFDQDNVYFTLTDGTTLTVPVKSEELIRLYNEAKNLVSRFQHQTYIHNKNTNDKLVDIVLFSGQSNSCGRAQLGDCTCEDDIMLDVPLEKAFSFNNTASTVPAQIVEPITANGTSYYGYIPAFINAYHATTNRKVCACYKSVGGTMINKFVPFVLDDLTGEPTTQKGTYYKQMVAAIDHAKTNIVANGYEIGEVLLVWCQGESEGVYLGNENKYAITYEKGLTSDQQKTDWYKKQFISLVEQLKADVGLSTGFIIRIGQRKTKGDIQNSPIIYAQNELGKEHDNIVLVSTLFAGAKSFIKEDGSIRNLMRDTSHYVPEGYNRVGLEAGVNAGIYINSNKQVKPILLEYHTLVNDDTTLYERPVDKFIYDPCRVDYNSLKDMAK